MERHRFRGDTRPAIGEHVGQIDDLEGFDDANEDDGGGDGCHLRPGDIAEYLPIAGAIEGGCLDLVGGLAFQGRQHDDEDEGYPLPGIADHDHETGGPGLGRPRQIAQAEPAPDGCQRALGHIGQHAEHVGDAHRRHHQRQEEHDAEKAAPGNALGAEHGQPHADEELRTDPKKDVEQGHRERAQLPARPEGRGDEQTERQDQRCANSPADDTRQREFATPDIVADCNGQQQDDDRQKQPALPGNRREDAKEMILLCAEQQLGEIGQADEADVIAAQAQLESRKCQIGGEQQRKYREGQDHQHARQDEQPIALPVQPRCQVPLHDGFPKDRPGAIMIPLARAGQPP